MSYQHREHDDYRQRDDRRYDDPGPHRNDRRYDDDADGRQYDARRYEDNVEDWDRSGGLRVNDDQFRRGSGETAYEDWGDLVRDALDSDKLDSFSETDSILRQINKGWSFMTEEDFDPVTLALDLMDESSIGRGKDYGLFEDMLFSLDRALKSIVNDYYQGFNSSIGTFSGVLNNIADSQNHVKSLKTHLLKCKQDLQARRSDLLQLWFKSQQYKEMISILDQIEELRVTPDKLEQLLQDKHYLTAATTLSTAIRTISKKEMLGIGALEDIRRGLMQKKSSLHDTLIEELHNHLYLKTSYCDSRWSKYTVDQAELPLSSNLPRKLDNSDIPRPPSPISATIAALTGSGKRVPPKPASNTKPNLFPTDANEVLTEDTDRNPETDSYYYIEILLESLAVLSKLPEALEAVQQRLPVEVYAVVDKTVIEVDERHANTVHMSWAQIHRTGMSDAMSIYALDNAEDEGKNEILKDLLWTLYSKLEAMLRGQKFVIDVCARILKREKKDGEGTSRVSFSLSNFKDIWVPVQSELRALLHDYLTDRDRNSETFANPIMSINEVLRERNQRDKQKQLFKFHDATPSPSLDGIYSATTTELTNHLRKTVPTWYVTRAKGEQSQTAFTGVIDRYAAASIVVGHRLLVQPDAYNVSVLIRPTLAFLGRLREIVPNTEDSSDKFETFLDEFVLHIFLPQIEDKVMQLIHRATNGSDAFQQDPNYKQLSDRPVVKSASALNILIQSLCRTLHSMPLHKDEYVRMIELILLKFYEKCSQRFQSIVTIASSQSEEDAEPLLSVSAEWAQEEGLVALLAQSPYFSNSSDVDAEYLKNLNLTEITLETKLKDARQLQPTEIIFDSKKLTSLGELYHSLKWFVKKIWELRRQTGDSAEPGSHHGRQGAGTADDGLEDNDLMAHSRRWSQANMEKRGDSDEIIGLPLTGDAAQSFDTLLSTYQQLAETCLFTLRIEIRCHMIFYLDLATKDGNYHLDEETYEPDPYIMTLNSDLASCEESTSKSLPINEQNFVFDGLSALVVHILIGNAPHITRMNANGVQKMIRNIQALQQNLTNIVSQSALQAKQLDRAREYYRLFSLGADAMMRDIDEFGPHFSFEEYRMLLHLIHDVAGGGSSEVTGEGGKTYSDYLMQLDELMYQHDE